MLLLLALGCAADCGDRPPTTAGDHVCRVPGQPGRGYILHLPASWDGASALPAVLALHGGGGKKESMNAITCRDGDEDDASCLSSVADAEGFAVVYPDGTAGLVGRTWNAGGGTDGWRCVSGSACKDGVDDLAYFDALLDELARAIPLDATRVYATGLSNGAAMAHRLACERADRFAAVAPVAGANQFGAAADCAPSRPVPILHIHGTDDPCWSYNGGDGACLQKDAGVYVSVQDSLLAWGERYGSTSFDETARDDTADDGTTVSELVFSGTSADLVHLRIDGGGHTWPGGDSYLPEDTVGKVSREFSASEEIWAFFAAHPMAP